MIDSCVPHPACSGLRLISLSHIFLQLCTGGDLFTYITGHIEAGKQLYEAEVKYVMYQLLQGLAYLHDRQISHRGKPCQQTWVLG